MLWLMLLLAQVQASPPATEPSRPKEILGLVDQARGLPPEFSADTLLRLAASRLIAETRWKKELIEQAFRSGSHAQLPYQRRGGIHTDARQSHEAWDNGLDSLTLQTRAVDAMIPLDPLRARAMYEEIVLPELPNPACEEVLTPNPDRYYDTALKVFNSGFTEKDREKGEPLLFLEGKVQTMQSPAQVVPVSRLITSAKMNRADRERLLTGFAVGLDRVRGSDRVYARTEFELVRMFMSHALSPQFGAGLVAPALRSYIVRQASGPRCADHVADARPGDSVQDFNTLVDQLNRRSVDYQKISAEEAKPAKEEGSQKLDDFWQSARSKQVLEALKWLNHGNRQAPNGSLRVWTQEERSGIEWNNHYVDTLKLIEGWKEDEEPSAEDYFAMKTHTYMTLANLVPPGKARDNAMGLYRSFLEQSYFLIENHNFWFTDVRFMLNNARSTSDVKDRDWMLDELSRSANPAIALYAQLDNLIPAK
jgi:hypothetical protein